MLVASSFLIQLLECSVTWSDKSFDGTFVKENSSGTIALYVVAQRLTRQMLHFYIEVKVNALQSRKRLKSVEV